jgi:hypothetical protein
MTTFEQFQATITAQRAQDEDMLLADATDERLQTLASFFLEAMHMPADRLPVVEREWHSLRLIARERVGWCRYINLVRDPTYTRHPATIYLIDPARSCCCEKHGYKSNIPYPEADVVIDCFKRAYCHQCPNRSPKGRNGS